MSSISRGYLKAEVINLLEQVEMDDTIEDINGATDLIIEPLINLFRMYFEPTFKETKEEVTVTTYATQEQVETRVAELDAKNIVLLETIEDLEKGAREQSQTIGQWKSYAETKDNNETVLLEANNKLKDSFDDTIINMKQTHDLIKAGNDEEIQWLRKCIASVLGIKALNLEDKKC